MKKEQKKTKEIEQREKNSNAKKAWMLWTGKNCGENSENTKIIVQCFVSMCFKVIAYIALIIDMLVFALAIYLNIASVSWAKEKIIINIVNIFIVIMFMIVIFFFAFFIKVISNEVKEEKDKHYVLSLFSGFITVVAFMITLISVLK